MKKRVWQILGLLVTGVLGYFLYELFTTPSMRSSNDRNAAASLKTLAIAEADFRANDRDKNGENDFWRGDVAGLYGIIPKGGTPSDILKGIERSVAAADDRPATDLSRLIQKQPKAGYWYRAIRKKGEPPVKTTHFAFCAFPAEYGKSGKVTLIVDEGNTLFQADLGHGRGIEVFPDDAELAARWSKMD